MSIWEQINKDTCCIAIDTETNGLFRKGMDEPRMVALAWSLFSIEKGSSRKQSFIVRADDFDPNPSGCLKHGIDKARAMRDGIPAVQILQEFRNDVHIFQPRLLVAHNVEFDIQVLIAESKRLGYDLSRSLSLPRFCTMKTTTSLVQIPKRNEDGYDERIAAYKRKHNMRTKRAKRGLAYYESVLSNNLHREFKYPTLKELSVHLFGSPPAKWHDALADVECCERCFRKIVEEQIDQHAAWKRNHDATLAQLDRDRQEREKCSKEREEQQRKIRNRLAEVENQAQKTIFNLGNLLFSGFIIMLTIFIPPFGIFLAVCAFFGIRGDYKRAQEKCDLLRKSLLQAERQPPRS